MSSTAESITCNAEFQSRHTLTEADFPWLASFGCQLPSSNEEVWLEHLNNIISIGSIWIEDAGTVSETQILEAREYFFSLLTKFEDRNLTRFKDSHFWTMPLDTVVLTQRELFQQGIDGPKVINAMPSILGYAPESVREKLNNLAGLGIDGPKVINAMPQILGYAPESVREKLNNLAGLGIDGPKVINAMPSILSLAPESVREKLNNLASLGIDGPKVINAMPSILSLAPESVREKLNNLASLGIDGPKVINAFPPILNLAPESVREKLNNLASLGIDGPKVINAMPSILGFAPESVKAKLRILYSTARAWRVEDYKLVVNQFIENHPLVLNYKPDRNKIIARIISNSLDSQVNVNPQVLNSVLKQNLEATLVAYLNNQNNIHQIDELIKLSKTYKKLGKQALREIIESNTSNDNASKIYRRAYMKREETSSSSI